MPWVHDRSPFHCLHNPKLPLSLLKDTRLGKTRAFWSIETSHLTPPLTLRFWPHGFTIFPGCVPGLPVLFHHPIPSSTPYPPHLFSLWLVCLLSQLLSKKRGLFRIHAGRKQRYPQLRACARGHAKNDRINNINLSPSLTQTICSAWKHSPFCGSVQCFFLLKLCFLLEKTSLMKNKIKHPIVSDNLNNPGLTA